MSRVTPRPELPTITLLGAGAYNYVVSSSYLESFYKKVWQALLSVKYGETVTYGELATMTGSPGAARAVGQAVHQHHLPLLVPCHRVVYRGGGVGNYSGGDGKETKQWLLQHEAQT